MSVHSLGYLRHAPWPNEKRYRPEIWYTQSSRPYLQRILFVFSKMFFVILKKWPLGLLRFKKLRFMCLMNHFKTCAYIWDQKSSRNIVYLHHNRFVGGYCKLIIKEKTTLAIVIKLLILSSSSYIILTFHSNTVFIIKGLVSKIQ